jgi:hypothetical protein
VDKTLVVNQSPQQQICLVSNARKYFDKGRRLTVQRSSYIMAVLINMAMTVTVAVGILCQAIIQILPRTARRRSVSWSPDYFAKKGGRSSNNLARTNTGLI